MDRLLTLRVDRTGLDAFVSEWRGRGSTPAVIGPQGSPGIDASSLRLAGGVAAWRDGPYVQIQNLVPLRQPRDATLMSLGGFRLSVDGEDLRASYGAARHG